MSPPIRFSGIKKQKQTKQTLVLEYASNPTARYVKYYIIFCYSLRWYVPSRPGTIVFIQHRIVGLCARFTLWTTKAIMAASDW